MIELNRNEDDRGFFARCYCEREFAEMGLESLAAQSNLSFNIRKGTLRGMHYQTAPFQEAKLIRCVRGSIYDVIIDLRPASASFRQTFAIELSDLNRKMLYVPRDFAHGFQTLESDTEVFYQMSQFYSADHARGVRWNDPAFGIQWPIHRPFMNDRDRTYPDFHADKKNE